MVKIGADTSGAMDGLGKVGGAVAGLGKTALMVGGAAGLGAIALGLKDAISSASDFDATMSGVGAVSGASAQQMGQLHDLALQLGKDTVYSASEAGQGIEELLKGGVSIQDVMGGAAQATLNLAAAGGVSLPDAAEIAADALNDFNLNGKDMAHVSDMIAGAANASAIDVGDFKFSLSSVG